MSEKHYDIQLIIVEGELESVMTPGLPHYKNVRTISTQSITKGLTDRDKTSDIANQLKSVIDNVLPIL